jgi:hypothetical protein
VKAADWIQLAAVIISAVAAIVAGFATIAAWRAAAYARDSAIQTRAAQLIDVHSRRQTALTELLGTIARMTPAEDRSSLSDASRPQAEGLRGKVYAVLALAAAPIPDIERVAAELDAGHYPGRDRLTSVEAQLRFAIRAETAAIHRF